MRFLFKPGQYHPFGPNVSTVNPFRNSALPIWGQAGCRAEYRPIGEQSAKAKAGTQQGLKAPSRKSEASI